MALPHVETELDTAAAELDGVLAHGEGPVRLDDNGDLVIGPLSAEDVPAEAAELKDELTGLLPFAPIASVLIELDRPARRPQAAAADLDDKRIRGISLAAWPISLLGLNRNPMASQLWL